MQRGETGRYETSSTSGETVRAFIPACLPPSPPLQLSARLEALRDRSHLALGRLDGVVAFLPEPDLFLYTYVRREALLSSQIEGSQSSLSDLLLFELEGAPGLPFVDDVVEVSSYVEALNHGLQRLADGFPLSSRLLREIHGVLLARGRGAHCQPGEFRRSQNWIGGTRPGNASFVPPPPGDVGNCIADLEAFIHNEHSEQTLPPLIKAGLAHVQFETIHPFLDGNGRLGRMLISMMLTDAGILRKPQLLYMSLFFKQHRSRYYELLDIVRREGDWEAWLDFFLEGVESTATSAFETMQRLLALFRKDEDSLRGERGSVRQVLAVMKDRPLTSISQLMERTGSSFPTVSRALESLMEHQIVREITGLQRNRVFIYNAYLAILNEQAEPL